MDSHHASAAGALSQGPARHRTRHAPTLADAYARASALLAALARQIASDRAAGGEAAVPQISARRLAPREAVVLQASAGQEIACDAGTLWITQGDGRDIVLAEGDRVVLRPTDTVVVCAMSGPAAFRHA